MPQEKTPGVYIKEVPAFPNSVVEVATAVPAFVGYTEKSERGTEDLTGVPTRISSLTDYLRLFGGPPTPAYSRTKADDGKVTFSPVGQKFYLFNSLRIYFNNGGGPCWIVSVGHYDAEEFAAGDFGAVGEGAWLALSKQQEPSMYVVPDAVALSASDYKTVSEAAILSCQTLGSRVAILDIYNGGSDRIDEIITGPNGFRNTVDPGDKPSYGMVYYPWLNTTIVESTDVDFSLLDSDSRSGLKTEIETELKEAGEVETLPDAVAAQLGVLENIPMGNNGKPDKMGIRRTHLALNAISQTYRTAMADLLKAINVLPPSAAMAGVFARTDNTIGVFKAPANTGLMSVLSPTVTISDAQQEDLNMPLDGKAVNAIRSFVGRGVVVWGARTLDGNSQDYRYINVRRTLIMLEQSVYYAALAYVFEPNVSSTWKSVQAMLENFLNNQWKAGALAGTKPEDAYDVSVGLGSTMTGNDILDGYMRITVRVAISRPAEFIVITFQQKMQTS